MRIIITTKEIKGTDKFLRGIMKPGRDYYLEIKETKTSKNRRRHGGITSCRLDQKKD